jgi:hypothetical protein
MGFQLIEEFATFLETDKHEEKRAQTYRNTLAKLQKKANVQISESLFWKR